MTKPSNRLLPFLFAVMFIYSGCAKQDVVKKDASLIPPVQNQAESGLKSPASSTKAPENAMHAPVATASSIDDKKKSDQPSKVAVASEDRKEFEKIYFDFDSATLSNISRKTLSDHFEILQKNPQMKIRIEGNCDERGSDEYNLALGERRALAASRYLTALGIATERLSSISYGEEKPADLGHDANAWAKNRRAEFVIIK